MRVYITATLMVALCGVSLAQATKNNSNALIEFDTRGRITRTTAPTFGHHLNKDNKKLMLTVRMPLADSLLNSYYKAELERRIATVNNLRNPRVREKLIGYRFTSADLDRLENEAMAEVEKFPKGLKELYGYTFLPSRGSTGIATYCLYSVSYPRDQNQEAVHRFRHLQLPSNFIDRTWSLPLEINDDHTEIERVEYEIRLSKPYMEKYNYSVTKPPASKESYKVARKTLTHALKKAEKFNSLYRKFGAGFSLPLKLAESWETSLQTSIDSLRSYFDLNKSFVEEWLWYTEGIPSLNPFYGGNGKGELEELAAGLKKNRADSLTTVLAIAGLTAKEAQVKEALKAANLKDKPTLDMIETPMMQTYSRYRNSLDSAQLVATRLNFRLDTVRKKYNAKVAALKKAAVEAEEFKVGDVLMYKGLLFPRSGNFFSRAKFQSAARVYERAGKLRAMHRLPTSYDENVLVHVLIENEKHSNTFSQTVTEIATDTAPFTSVFSGLVDQLAEARKSVDKSFIDGLIEKRLEERTSEKGVRIENLLRLLGELEFYRKEMVAPPDLPKSLVKDQTPLLRTDYYQPNFDEKPQASKKLVIDVGNRSQKDTIAFRVNKLYYVLPTIGLTYAWANDPEVTLKADGSIDKITYYNGSALMMGIKAYPLGPVPVYDPHFVVSAARKPTFDYRKIHIIAGVNLIHPLKQFYLGAGIDLWSGLSVSWGAYGIQKKQQSLVNQQVESKNYFDYQDNYFVSVSLDPSLAVKLISFFKKP